MNVIWKATEKEQCDRYQTALEFKNDILAALRKEPTLLQKISDWIQEHVMLFISLVTLIAAIIIAIVIILIK